MNHKFIYNVAIKSILESDILYEYIKKDIGYKLLDKYSYLDFDYSYNKYKKIFEFHDIKFNILLYFKLKILNENKNKFIKSEKVYFLIYNDFKEKILFKLKNITKTNIYFDKLRYLYLFKKMSQEDIILFENYNFYCGYIMEYGTLTIDKRLYDVYFKKIIHPAALYKSVR